MIERAAARENATHCCGPSTIKCRKIEVDRKRMLGCGHQDEVKCCVHRKRHHRKHRQIPVMIPKQMQQHARQLSLCHSLNGMKRHVKIPMRLTSLLDGMLPYSKTKHEWSDRQGTRVVPVHMPVAELHTISNVVASHALNLTRLSHTKRRVEPFETKTFEQAQACMRLGGPRTNLQPRHTTLQ